MVIIYKIYRWLYGKQCRHHTLPVFFYGQSLLLFLHYKNSKVDYSISKSSPRLLTALESIRNFFAHFHKSYILYNLFLYYIIYLWIYLSLTYCTDNSIHLFEMSKVVSRSQFSLYYLS